MITTVDEVNSDKTKVPEEFIFRSVLLDYDLGQDSTIQTSCSVNKS